MYLLSASLALLLACAPQRSAAPLHHAATASPIDTACARILADNRATDDAARAAHARSQASGAIPMAWGMDEPWLGACLQLRAGAWAVVLDSITYAGTHDVTFTIAWIDAGGRLTRARDAVRFNHVRFELAPSADGTAADATYTSGGPEDDFRETIRYRFDGKRVIETSRAPISR